MCVGVCVNVAVVKPEFQKKTKQSHWFEKSKNTKVKQLEKQRRERLKKKQNS